MPSGRTHDRITLWSLPFLAGLTFALTRNANVTLLLLGGFLFSGLMFGPDLDIHSRQFIRWGWLRWIWIPYQKAIRHRSVFSHGVIIGTIVRSLYLAFFLSILGFLVLGIAQFFGNVNWNWQMVVAMMQRSLSQYPHEWLALIVGLELGAFSHYISDWGGSTYKRMKTQGLSGLLPKKKQKTKTRSKSTQKVNSKRTTKNPRKPK